MSIKRPLDCAELERIFQQTFFSSYNTRLQGGGEEPIYLPAGLDSSSHVIVYRHDYAASALHEVSHWCVAGKHRRLLEDFGYWYAADGRTAKQQAQFELVEVKPQAFEWIFSMASGLVFRVSADNLTAGLGASEGFKDSIFDQVCQYCQHGLPDRADQFARALAKAAGTGDHLCGKLYQRDAL